MKATQYKLGDAINNCFYWAAGSSLRTRTRPGFQTVLLGFYQGTHWVNANGKHESRQVFVSEMSGKPPSSNSLQITTRPYL